MNHDLEALVAEARDPSTPFERLKELVEHPEEEVRRAVLDNPHVCPANEDGTLTTSLLWRLAKEFPEEIASHPLFALHALVGPAEDMVAVVMEVVRRTTDVGLIQHVLITCDSDWYVRQSVAANPNTPLLLLRNLGNPTTEDETYVRRAVARNPSTPEDVLRLLGNEATESDWYVRDAAQKALEARGLP